MRILPVILGLLVLAAPSHAAYQHMGDIDSPNVVAAYPQKAGTKVDSCATCHTGGSYVQSGRTVTVGSCQWCHRVSNYDPGYQGFGSTLNPYGVAYRNAGRTAQALLAISHQDADGDGYANGLEMDAGRFPGNAADDPAKFTAPYRIYDRAELEAMPAHNQFLLMNATRSQDFYAEYDGVTVEELLRQAGASPLAETVVVYSPDGFAQTHPLEAAAGSPLYPVLDAYPQAQFFYDANADAAANTAFGWCSYASPRAAGAVHGQAIDNPDGLRLMLAIRRDGDYIPQGVLDTTNRLNGEGPYRLVTPQKVVSPPDQSATQPAAIQSQSVWPFDAAADHNAGAATRSATMLEVQPIPAGFTAIDPLEAGWNFVDQNRIIVYGAVDPAYALADKLASLKALLGGAELSAYRSRITRLILLDALKRVERRFRNGEYAQAVSTIEGTMLQMANRADRLSPIQSAGLRQATTLALRELAALFRLGY